MQLYEVQKMNLLKCVYANIIDISERFVVQYYSNKGIPNDFEPLNLEKTTPLYILKKSIYHRYALTKWFLLTKILLNILIFIKYVFHFLIFLLNK